MESQHQQQAGVADWSGAGGEDEDDVHSLDDLPLAATSELVSSFDQSAASIFGSSRPPDAHPHEPVQPTVRPGLQTLHVVALQHPMQGAPPQQPQEQQHQQVLTRPGTATDAAAISSPSATMQLASKLAWSARLAELALSDAMPQQVLTAAAAAALVSSPHASPAGMASPPPFPAISPTKASSSQVLTLPEATPASGYTLQSIGLAGLPTSPPAPPLPLPPMQQPMSPGSMQHAWPGQPQHPQLQPAYSLQGENVWVSEGQLLSGSPGAAIAAGRQDQVMSAHMQQQQQQQYGYGQVQPPQYTAAAMAPPPAQQVPPDPAGSRPAAAGSRGRRSTAGGTAPNLEVDRLLAQVQALDASNQELSRKVAELSTQLEQAQAQHAQQVDALQAAKDSVSEAETRLRAKEQQLQVSESHVDALSGELAAARAALAKAQAAQQEAQDQVVVWRGEHQAVARELEATTRKLNTMGVEERRLQVELQQLRKEHDVVADTLTKARVELAEARERLRVAAAQAQQSNSLAARAEMGNEGLSSQLNQMRRKVADVEARNAGLQEETRLLRQELAAQQQRQAGAGLQQAALAQARQPRSPLQILNMRPAGVPGSVDVTSSSTAQLLPGPGAAGPSANALLPPPQMAAPLPAFPGSPPGTAPTPGQYPHPNPYQPYGAPPQSWAAPSQPYGAAVAPYGASVPQHPPADEPLRSSTLEEIRAAVAAAAARRAQAEAAAGGPLSVRRSIPFNEPLAQAPAAAAYTTQDPTWSPGHSAQQPSYALPEYASMRPASAAQGLAADMPHLYSGYAGYSSQSYRPQDGVSSLLAGDPYASQAPSGAYTAGAPARPASSPPASAALPPPRSAVPQQYSEYSWQGDRGLGSFSQEAAAPTFSSNISSAVAAAGLPRGTSGLPSGAAGLPLSSTHPPYGILPTPSMAPAGHGGSGAPPSAVMSASANKYPLTASQPDQQQQHRVGLDVPYGTDRTLKDLLARSQAMEDALVGLCTERSTLEAEYSKLPLHGGRNTRQRSRKAEIEARMEAVQKEISNLRLALKKLHGK